MDALPRRSSAPPTSRPSSSTAPRAPASRPRWCRCSSPATGCWCRSSAGSATCSPRSPSGAAPRCTPSRRPWGEVFDARGRSRTPSPGCGRRSLALVQGDTSTTMCQPLAEPRRDLPPARRARSTATPPPRLGGNALRDRRVGHSTSPPPGCRSASAARRAARRSPCRRRAVDADRGPHATSRRASATTTTPTAARASPRNYLDLAQVMDYWGPRRLNHHTEATTMLYGARECARAARRGGPRRRGRAARLHGAAMLAGVRGLGLAVFGDVAHKMHNVVAVEIPDGVDGDAVRTAHARRTSASRSAPRSVRCTAGSGGSARWATTPAGTPC